MNKILLEDKIDNVLINEDTVIEIIERKNDLTIETDCDCKVFLDIKSSCFKLNVKANHNLSFNIFSFDSSPYISFDILKDNLNIKYGYSTINENDNTYKVDINNLAKNINSEFINHGINKTNKSLDFVVNTHVPSDKTGIKTFQDSKIIVLEDMNASIKPNLYIDNDDIEAEHSAYIGRFKDEELFYLMTRGLNEKQAIDLLVRSFLIGNMDLSFSEKDKVLEIIKRYWR